jgi:hypothetical protein
MWRNVNGSTYKLNVLESETVHEDPAIHANVQVHVPSCDLLHQARTRTPTGGASVKQKTGFITLHTHHGSSLVASLTLASISLTFMTTFLAFVQHQFSPSPVKNDEKCSPDYTCS